MSEDPSYNPTIELSKEFKRISERGRSASSTYSTSLSRAPYEKIVGDERLCSGSGRRQSLEELKRIGILTETYANGMRSFSDDIFEFCRVHMAIFSPRALDLRVSVETDIRLLNELRSSAEVLLAFAGKTKPRPPAPLQDPEFATESDRLRYVALKDAFRAAMIESGRARSVMIEKARVAGGTNLGF